MSRLCRIRRGQPQGTQSLCRCTSREITVVTRVKPCAVYRIGGVVKLRDLRVDRCAALAGRRRPAACAVRHVLDPDRDTLSQCYF